MSEPLYVTKKGQCQFCKKPLDLKIDASYALTRDPFKLIQKAACNRCADLRYKRTLLHEALQKVVADFSVDRRGSSREVYGNMIERITKKYATLIADWTGTPNQWEREIVEHILSRPDRVGEVVARMWKMVKPSDKQQELGVVQ